MTGTRSTPSPAIRCCRARRSPSTRSIAGQQVPVVSGKTNANGTYSIRFSPTATGSQRATGQISTDRDPTLNPQYGDILSPSATTAVNVTVHSKLTKLSVKSQGGRALLVGSVAPGTGHVKGTLAVFARPKGSKHAFKKVATDRLGASDGNFAVAVPLKAKKWQFKVTFADPKQVVATTSRVMTVKIGKKPAATVSVRSLKVKNGKLTLTAGVKPKGAAGAKVKLFALNTAAGSPAKFSPIASAKVKKGKTKVTLHASLKRKTRWLVLQLRSREGQAVGLLEAEDGQRQVGEWGTR